MKEVLSGLRDCTGLTQDVQLKILRLLPSLLQNYAALITGELLATALHTCFLLLASKAGVISNTAAATLQQLVVSVFDKVQQEDEAHSDDFILDVPVEDGEISVQKSALDAYRLLHDLCLLIEGQKAEFLKRTSASPNFCLELVEAIFSSHAETVAHHPEQVHVLRLKLMPFMIRALSDRLPFSTTVRSMRLLPVVFGNMLGVLATECEMILSLLNHMLDPNASVLWKRVLCMEVLRSVHSVPALVRDIFTQFDAKDGKRNILQDQMSLMVHLASEKPAVIGLGQHSTVPATDQDEEGMDEMAALQAEGISGTIGIAMTLKSSTAPGISTRLSSMRVSCLEQLDKNDAPSIPPAYIYSLVLVCLNSFSEGIAKFLLPFTVPSDKGRRRARTGNDFSRDKDTEAEGIDTKPAMQRSSSSAALKKPTNPLSLENHVLFDQIKTSAAIVDACWPALLAAYSTYFHAALDSEYYRDLVRSFQKFTQVSGLLQLSTPRDAFLTSLGKNAVPVGSIGPPGNAMEAQDQERQSLESQPSTSEKGRSSVESGRASLNSRNLLCLRALLNLGIALGPVLGQAWKIVLGTLQQADLVINQIMSMRQRGHGSQNGGNGNDGNFLGDIGDQIGAVGGAAERVFESTSDLPDESYLDALNALCGLLRGIDFDEKIVRTPTNASLSTPASHKRGPSISSNFAVFTGDSKLNLFVIDKLSRLIQHNEFRLLENTKESSGWTLLTESLLKVASAQYFDATLRIRAARVLTELVNLTTSNGVPQENVEETRHRGLKALENQIFDLYPTGTGELTSPKGCEVEIHCILLESLHTALERYGETLTEGWLEVFSIIDSVFSKSTIKHGQAEHILEPRMAKVKGSKLVRTAFSSLQLICSDFLGALPQKSYSSLLPTISSFCTQQDEFNISLTSTTLFCNVSDHLWQGESVIQLDKEARKGNEQAASQQDFLSKSRLWLQLLLALVDSTTDERPEVRRGAIHSITRVLDTSGEQLSAESWIECHLSTFMAVFQRNQSKYVDAEKKGPADSEVISSWNETTIMILDSFPSVFAIGIDGVLEADGFSSLWQTFLSHADAILRRKCLNVSAATYTALAKLLSDIEQTGKKANHCAKSGWSLWNDRNPVDHRGLPRKAVDNQAALLAYARCLAALLPLLASEMSGQMMESTLHHLKLCIKRSSTTPYPGDIDSLTPLQDQVVECIKMLRADNPEAILHIIATFSSIATLAYDRDSSTIEAKGPTFVALSKTGIDLLSHYLVINRSTQELCSGGTLVNALKELAHSIHMKYSWEQQGKDPPLWKKATQATIAIVEAFIPALQKSQLSAQNASDFWKAVIDCLEGIILAPDDEASMTQQLFVDEDTEIQYFLKLYDLIIPTMGASDSFQDQDLGQILVWTLLRHSFIHEVHPDDLPLLETTNPSLNQLMSVKHIGRTNDLYPSSRAKMSYAVTDKLFDLVARRRNSPPSEVSAWKGLAISASPFFILRAGLILKAYVLDQPLRGRMPQPGSQRKELLYILRRLTELSSEPAAFSDASAVTSTEQTTDNDKKHLFMIYPLIVRALIVTKRDDELREALSRVLGAIGHGAGIQGPGNGLSM